MKDMLSMLEGKKTYLSAVAGVVCAVAYLLGWIDQNTLNGLLALFGFTGLASVRDAISKK